MRRTFFPQIEPLESRIAPAALVAVHPLPDIVAGIGKTGASIDLGSIYDADGSYNTHVKFITNFDSDAATPGLQGNIIEIELYDHDAPLTVQNFLSYALSKSRKSDYDGTIIHRSADFGPGSGPGKDIIQGGGFEVPALNHIPTGPELHNEYSDERPNERGTIAVAKTGLNPNTATSEWFINVNDNSSILGGANNGGYTVFGKVVAGLDLVDKIAAQQTYNYGGAFGEIPLQNYNENPDNNPATPPPPVQFSNLIQITDTQVIKPANGVSPGVRFEVVSVVDSVTGQPSDLLSAKVSGGDTLALKYKAGEMGVAKVTVRATNPTTGDTGLEDFLVTVQPNLIAANAGDTLADLLVPGETGTASVKLTNTAGGLAEGLVDVKFYLSEVNALDPNGTTLDADDVAIGSKTQSIKIASGKSAVVTADVALTAGMALEAGKSYRVLAEVTTPEGSSVVELFTDDNVAQLGDVHQFADAAGKSNLVAGGVSDNLPGLLVPGDDGQVKFSLTNNAAKTAQGAVDVKFFLSRATGAGGVDPNGNLLGADDVQIGQILGKAINLEEGESLALSTGVRIPDTLTLAPGAQHRILAQVTLPDGSTVTDALASDNLGFSQATHSIYNLFGTPVVNGEKLRGNTVLSYPDAEGNTVKMKLSGAGYGLAEVGADGTVSVSVYNSTASSALAITTESGEEATLRNLSIVTLPGATGQPDTGGSIGKVSAGNVNLLGDFVAVLGLKSLVLGDFTGSGETSHFLGIGYSEALAKVKPVVRLDSVEDTRVESYLTLSSLSATDWRDVNATQETVAAVGLGKFSVQGNFEADMSIVGDVKVSSFTVGGTMKSSAVAIASDVGKVTLGAMEGSRFLVGTTTVPTALSDFNAARSIASFIVKGTGGTTPAMADSVVAARSFGSISVASVDGASGSGDFGFFSGSVGRYERGAVVKTKISAPGDFDTLGENYVARILPATPPAAA